MQEGKTRGVAVTEGLMCAALCGLLIVYQCNFPVWIILLKSLASAMFVLTGCLGYVRVSMRALPHKWILAALVCSMAGDVLLALDNNEGMLFVLGVASFAAAHILFAIAFSNMMPVCKKDLAGTAVIFIILMLILCMGSFDFKGLFPVLAGYAAIISFMVTKALSLWVRRADSKKAVTAISVGGVLFLVSDLVLLYFLFGIDMPREIQSVNWVLYYAAQGLLAYSIGENLPQ